jgi:hypothetical protein
MLIRVSAILAGLDNRFALTHPIAPDVTPGAGIASTAVDRT